MRIVAQYAKHFVDYGAYFTRSVHPLSFILPMTIPALLFALLIALLCGVLFHLLRGGGGWRLLLYIGLSVLGFTLGQAVSMWLGWNLFMFGALDIGMGVIGSLVFLTLGDWLSRIETSAASK